MATLNQFNSNLFGDFSKQLSTSTQKLCLENVVKLYLKVRSFSYARDYLNKYKIKQKHVNKKALRKDLKRSTK